MEALSKTACERICRALDNERNPVQIGYAIYSVDRVNPVENSFEADIKLFTRWHDQAVANDPDMVSLRTNGTLPNGTNAPLPKLLGVNKFSDAVVKELPGDPDPVSETRPRLDFANAAACELVERTSITYLSPNDDLGWVRSEARYRCVFKQTMDVHCFPFDVQILKIIVRMPERSDRGRKFSAYASKGVGELKEMKNWIKLPEWMRYEPMTKFERDSRGRARMVIELGMRRKARYYMQNVVGVNAVITAICFTSFGIEITELGERLGVCLTMLLTAVAFKIVLGDSLPKVSYLTVMDVYLNGSFGFMLVCTLSCFIFAVWARVDTSMRPQEQDTIDLVAFITLAGSFALFHVYFAWRCRRAVADGDKKLGDRKRASEVEEELKKKQQKLQMLEESSRRLETPGGPSC